MAPRAKTGRPPKYHTRYCGMLIRFFDIEPFSAVKIPHYDESGKKHKSGRHKGEGVVTHYETKKEPNRTPTLQRFAKKIKVGISTVYDWLNKEHASFHQAFSDAFTCARACRRAFLIENELHGTYKSGSFRYIAGNLTDMTDIQKHELTGEGGKPIPMSIVDFGKIDPNE
ncbi:MAG: hypothetical protein IIC00_15775 [Planctomycetes bacterium]|nr:hypothetical protein [Planctomycetota bacterium]